MNTTKWSHLPNAAHIDAVIASVKANPDDWVAARNAARDVALDVALDAARDVALDVALDAARNAARDVALDAARNAALDAAWYAAWYAAWWTARNAILALIAYDDCAHMLDSDPDDLRILSKLGSHAATLMIPAAIAFKLIREKQLITVDTTL